MLFRNFSQFFSDLPFIFTSNLGDVPVGVFWKGTFREGNLTNKK